MKKTLIATAIAGAMSFSVAAQAAPTVYGNIQLVVDAKNDMTAYDNGSTVGFKGEEAMEGGLTSFYKAEFEFNAGAATGLNSGDQAYLGVKGAFGEVKVGKFDTLTDNFVGDAISDGEVVGADTVITNNGREAQQLAYVGDFGGIKVGASVSLNKANGTAGTNVSSYTAADSKDQQAMQFAISVPVGDMTVAAAMDTKNSDVGASVVAPMGDLTIGAKFETGKGAAANGKDETVIAASAAMNYGMGSAYAVVSSKMEDSKTGFGVGANYNLTNSLYVFGEVGTEQMEASVIGAVLSF